jgi:uncharacterized protein (TIGR02145 family)
MKHCYFLFLTFLFLACGNLEEPNLGKQEFGEVSDIEGNKYLTVKIGNQVWMAENLKTSTYSDGSPIPQLTSNSAWGRPTNSPEVFKPGWSYFQNNASNNLFHGKLYNWFAISGPKNCCPDGWSVPTRSDFEELLNSVGTGEDGTRKLKKEGVIWPQSDLASNKSGFSAFPSGYRNNGGSFEAMGIMSIFWTSNPSPIGIMLFSNVKTPSFGSYIKEFGLSVRCIKK